VRRALAPLLLLAGVAGCQTTPGPVFPPPSPPLVWPPAPDRPRIQYVGELRGAASLNVRPTGWAAVRQAVTGEQPGGAFLRPSAVAVDGPRVYVADTGLAVVHVLDIDARTYSALAGSATERFQVPIDLCILADGQLAVADRARGVVDVFDRHGRWTRAIRHDLLTAPVGLAYDPAGDRLWISDAASHAVFVAVGTAAPAPRFGQRGTAPGDFNFPGGLAWHPATGLAVVDALNFRVQVLAPDGAPRVVFGQKGDAAGDFARPRDVAIDAAGHLYVVDNQFENIQVFDGAGRLLMAFGQGGTGPGEFALPGGLCVGADDRIWVADGYNRRVQVFQYLPEEDAP
jgi:DNA-binding beta-propeller fold protein YncE